VCRADSRDVDGLRAIGVIVIGSVGYVRRGLILVHVFVLVFPSCWRARREHGWSSLAFASALSASCGTEDVRDTMVSGAALMM
jgi:hypothetical protein